MYATPTSVTTRRQLLPPLGHTAQPLKRFVAASCALSLTQKRVAGLCSARQERCSASGSRFTSGAKEEPPMTTASRFPPLLDDISTKMLTYCELPSTVHRHKFVGVQQFGLGLVRHRSRPIYLSFQRGLGDCLGHHSSRQPEEGLEEQSVCGGVFKVAAVHHYASVAPSNLIKRHANAQHREGTQSGRNAYTCGRNVLVGMRAGVFEPF